MSLNERWTRFGIWTGSWGVAQEIATLRRGP